MVAEGGGCTATSNNSDEEEKNEQMLEAGQIPKMPSGGGLA